MMVGQFSLTPGEWFRHKHARAFVESFCRLEIGFYHVRTHFVLDSLAHHQLHAN